MLNLSDFLSWVQIRIWIQVQVRSVATAMANSWLKAEAVIGYSHSWLRFGSAISRFLLYRLPAMKPRLWLWSRLLRTDFLKWYKRRLHPLQQACIEPHICFYSVVPYPLLSFVWTSYFSLYLGQVCTTSAKPDLKLVNFILLLPLCHQYVRGVVLDLWTTTTGSRFQLLLCALSMYMASS
jgi:hypothetical protein